MWTAEKLETFRTTTHSLHREGCMTMNELGEMLGYQQVNGTGGRIGVFLSGEEPIPAHTQTKLDALAEQRARGELLVYSGTPDYEYLKRQRQQYPTYSAEQLAELHPVPQACVDMYGSGKKGCTAIAQKLGCSYQAIANHCANPRRLPRGRDGFYLPLYLEAIARRLQACQRHGSLESVLQDPQAQQAQLIDLSYLQQAATQRGLSCSTEADCLQQVSALSL